MEKKVTYAIKISYNILFFFLKRKDFLIEISQLLQGFINLNSKSVSKSDEIFLECDKPREGNRIANSLAA